jgi:anti-anti-sigma regulatory factor
VKLCVDGPPPRVAVCGELDVSSVEYFDAELGRILSWYPRIIIDICGLTLLDSAGIRALFVHRDRYQALLVGAGTVPARALSASGMSVGFPLALVPGRGGAGSRVFRR